MKVQYSLLKCRELFFLLVASSIVLTVFIGCMQSYGRFSHDDHIDQAFKNGEILKDLKYYYSGRESKPDAIIGIDSAYMVPSDFWIEFEPYPEQLKRMKAKVYGGHRFGSSESYMLAPDGTVIGVWFFGPNVRSFMVDQQNRSVEVIFRIPSRP